MRIGEVAARTGLTTRTIRYYEEVGLLPLEEGRAKGQHRHYDEADVAQLRLIHAMCSLLGNTLDEVQRLVRPELGRAVSDRRWFLIETVSERLTVVEAALANVEHLLSLVRIRREELQALEEDLEQRLAVIESRPVVGA
jgi:DNA-binding transcriptional MerR regulator